MNPLLHFMVLISCSGCHCEALWSSYIELESTSEDPIALKKVFFRGITSLPWSKSFVLHGLDRLCEVVDTGELQKTCQILEQREMRIHSNI
jgi:hypothetical protein